MATGEFPAPDRLESWKEISEFLGRDVRTCSRWAKELNLPIHRVNGASPRSKVFAYRAELEAWLRDRPASPALSPATPRRPGRTVRVAAAAALGALALGAAAWIGLRFAASFRPEGPSIAVAPFKNLNGEAPDQYLSSGVTQQIVERLAGAGRVQLVSAGKVPEIERSLGDPRLIRGQIGADYLLRGAVLKDETDVHLDIQVIRISDATPVLSLRVNDRVDNLPYMIEKLGLQIARQVGFPSPGPSPAGPASPAQDDTLKGRYLLSALGRSDDPWVIFYQGRLQSGLGTREANDLAIAIFQDALERDPEFAPALVGLAECYVNYVNFGWDHQRKWLDAAESLLAQAQRIRPGLADYYATRIEVLLLLSHAFEVDRRVEAAALAREALVRFPFEARITSIAGYCRFDDFARFGRAEDLRDAIDLKTKSFWMDTTAVGNIVLGEALMLDRRFDAAIGILNELRPYDKSGMALMRLGEVHYYRGDLDRSLAIMEEVQSSLESKVHALLFQAMIAARRGEARKALDLVARQSLLVSPVQGPVPQHELLLASIFFGLGERDRGFERLRTFFRNPVVAKERNIYLRYISLDPNFDTVRADRTFQEIVNGGERWAQAEPFA